MKTRIRQNLIWFFSALFPGMGDGGAILMYHSIVGNKGFKNVRPDEFEGQMEYLTNSRFRVISLEDFCLRLKRGESVRNMIALTFDDGYRDFLSEALPVLKKYNFPATVFVITGKLGEGELMSQEELGTLSDEPLVSIMPHTHTHPNLDKLDLKQALGEINQSRQGVKNITGKPANILAYPRGRYSIDIVEELKNSEDWLSALTVRPGLIRRGDNPFLLKRIPIDSEVLLEMFPSYFSRGREIYEKLKIWS